MHTAETIPKEEPAKKKKRAIHFGKAVLFLNVFERWDAIAAFLIIAFSVVPDVARTETWIAMTGNDINAIFQAKASIAWSVVRLILGGVVIVYLLLGLNPKIRAMTYEKIAEADLLKGSTSIKVPWILVCTILFFVATGWGGFLMLVPATMFLFLSPYRLRSWKNKPRHVNTAANTDAGA